MPEDRRNRFVNDYSLTPYDAHVLTLEQDISEYFDAAAKSSKAPKLVANWIISELLRLLSEAKITVGECKIKPEMLGEMVNMIDSGAINGKIAKEVFADMFENGKTAAEIVKEKGLVQVSDESAILGFVQQAIAANPDQVQQFKDGKTAVLQFFVGQVMKASRGKANPKSVIKLLQEELSR